MRWALVVAVAASLAAAAAGAAPGVPALDHCVHAGPHTKIVRFHPRGAAKRVTGRAAVIGTGPAGVVFLNQSGASLCSWLPFARGLAALGIRSMVFDYAYGNPEDDAIPAAAKLRSLGVRRFVFLGASLGTRGAVVAGAAGLRGTRGLVCLSFDMSQGDVLRAARRVRTGALLVTADNDPFGSYDESQTLMRLIPSRDKTLTVVPGDTHGVDLLGDAQIRTGVLGWLRRHLS